MFKVHINSRPSLTISKSFRFKRYNNMSNYLKVLYGSQNHTKIDSRNKPIKTLYNKVTLKFQINHSPYSPQSIESPLVH